MIQSCLKHPTFVKSVIQVINTKNENMKMALVLKWALHGEEVLHICNESFGADGQFDI